MLYPGWQRHWINKRGKRTPSTSTVTVPAQVHNKMVHWLKSLGCLKITLKCHYASLIWFTLQLGPCWYGRCSGEKHSHLTMLLQIMPDPRMNFWTRNTTKIIMTENKPLKIWAQNKLLCSASLVLVLASLRSKWRTNGTRYFHTYTGWCCKASSCKASLDVTLMFKNNIALSILKVSNMRNKT